MNVQTKFLTPILTLAQVSTGPLFSTFLSVQYISSAQKGPKSLSTTLQTHQFNTTLSSTPKTTQFNTAISSTPKTPQFNFIFGNFKFISWGESVLTNDIFWKIELFKVCECWVNWDKSFLSIWPKMHKPQRRSSYQAKIPNLNLAGIRWNIRSLTGEYTSEKCFSSLFQVLNLLTSIWSSHVNS